MKSLILSIGFFICYANTNLSANDTKPERPTGIITGTIIDQKSKSPIEYATVALYPNNDTASVVKGVVSNDQGQYELSEIPTGTYDLKISFIGYSPVTIKGIKINRNQQKIDLPETALNESTSAINEVQIVFERLKGEEQIDKTVYSVNDQVRNASTSGLDMLKHVPAVSVDFQENVTLEGRSDILFFVDGVERNKDFIAQLDPSIIDKVEIMTNPGVKYSADISGVINLVLVKEPRIGINGSVKLDVPNPKIVLINPRANLEYGNQNFRTFVGYRFHMEEFDGKSLMEKSMNDALDPYNAEIAGKGQNMWNNGSGNFGFDWFLNETSSLNFYSELSHYNGRERDYYYNESIWVGDSLIDYQINNKNSDNGGISMFYSLYFKKKFNDAGDELTTELRLYDFNGGHEANFNYTEYDPLNISNALYNNAFTEEVRNNRNNGEFKIDYTKVIDKIKHETGYRGLYQWMKNEKTLSNTSDIDKFEYNEIRNIGYYSITGNINKLTLQGGIRYENSVFQIPGEDNINFDIWLPQSKISYKISDAHTLKLSYRKKVYRPSIQDLNPFEIFIDSTLVRRGNPTIKPAIENKAELSYSINFKQNYVSPSLYYMYTNNGITEYSSVEDNITVISQANIMDRYEYGLSISGAAMLKIMRLNFYAAGFKRILDNDGVRNEKLSWRTNLTAITMLPKEIVLFATMNYNSPNIGYQREYKRDMLFLFGLEKSLSKKAKISGYYNPFIKDFTYNQVNTVYGNTIEDWQGSLNIRQAFVIEFTYNFNYGKKINKINRSTDYEQDGGGGLF